MTELEKIKHLEYYFPKIFSDMEERDFGVIFYNVDNFDSNDSNHAVIFRDCDYEKAIWEIKEFYFSKKLEPRIYSSLGEGQLQKIRPYLECVGFKTNDYGYTDYLVYNGKSGITEPYTLNFRRVNTDDDLVVFSQLVEESAVVRTQGVISRRVQSPDYYLYIGYTNNVPAVMASFQFDDNMTARLDEVETAKTHRGKGYARQMTRYLTDVFEKQGGKLFFTWATNDTAQRVYLQGGFDVKYKLPAWSAFLGILDGSERVYNFVEGLEIR